MTAANNKQSILRTVAEAQVPTIFSEGVLTYSVGPQVSKLSFGVETAPGVGAAPVAHVVLPTEALITMVADLRHVLKNPEIRQHMSEAMARLVARIDDLDR